MIIVFACLFGICHGFQHSAERGMIFGYNKATNAQMYFNIFTRACCTTKRDIAHWMHEWMVN